MLSDREKIKLFNRNIDNYWRMMGNSPVIELIEEEDVMLCQSAAHISRHEILNTVLRSSFHENNTAQKVLDIQSQFENRDQPFTWLVNEKEAPSNLKSTLFQFGFESIGKFHCKFLSLEEYQEQPVNSPAEFRFVENINELEDWIIPQQAAKSLDSDSAEEYLKIRRDCFNNYRDHYFYLIGYFNGKPISSATLFIDEDIAGLFNGCTVPEMRNQGVGTASVIFRLNAAKQKGCSYAVTESSRHMNNITDELGFESLLAFHELGYGLH